MSLATLESGELSNVAGWHGTTATKQVMLGRGYEKTEQSCGLGECPWQKHGRALLEAQQTVGSPFLPPSPGSPNQRDVVLKSALIPSGLSSHLSCPYFLLYKMG